MCLSAQQECKARTGVGLGVSGGVRVGRRTCDVHGDEQRRELDDRHDLDVPGLEVWYVAGRESVRAVVGVVCGLCVCVVLERRACGGGVCATPKISIPIILAHVFSKSLRF